MMNGDTDVTVIHSGGFLEISWELHGGAEEWT